MAKSYKKNPWIKDNGGSKKYYKKLSGKTMRSRSKDLIKKEKWDEVMPIPHECVNQWDICDWKSLAEPGHFWSLYFMYAKGKYRLRK